MDPQTKVLRSPFDFNTHLSTFINYCEVVIYENGLIEYAVPSHVEKLISVIITKYNWTRDYVSNKISRTDWLDDLHSLSNCVSIRTDSFDCKTVLKENSGGWGRYYVMTKLQKEAIEKLESTGCCNNSIIKQLNSSRVIVE